MNVALLGIGLMGQALGEHLITQGQTVTAFNRSPEKIIELQKQGATIASTAQDAIKANNFCILMLSDATAINTVLDSIHPDTFKNKIIIQMGTISPDESYAIAQRITDNQGHYLECPVLGSLPEARNGTLILMAAGTIDDYQTALPLLNIIGKAPQYIGAIGQGATLKLAMNQLIVGLTASFSLSLALVTKKGVQPEKFMEILRESALYAPTFDKKLDRMLQDNFANPNFPTKHLAKDTRLFLLLAKQLDLETCALEGIDMLIDKTLAQGLADTDYSALYSTISKLKLLK